jgi:hypothetical protein
MKWKLRFPDGIKPGSSVFFASAPSPVRGDTRATLIEKEFRGNFANSGERGRVAKVAPRSILQEGRREGALIVGSRRTRSLE